MKLISIQSKSVCLFSMQHSVDFVPQALLCKWIGKVYKHYNGLLLHCMHKQQDFFGCLAEILGCLGLREAANLEIWPLRPRRGRKGQSSKVGSLEKALGQPKIEARPPKRSRCICIQYNRWFCCIFGQRFMPFHHQSLSSSVDRASGSYAAAPSSIPGFGIVF